MRASGGYRLFSSTSAGVSVAAGSGSWTSMSDRNAKENFESIDAQAVLEKVAALPLSTWNYKSQDSAIRHVGPMAQDFKTAFSVGETETGISNIDADGVALAAIQGLNQKVEEQRAELKAKDEELKALWKIVTELKAALLPTAGKWKEVVMQNSKLKFQCRICLTIACAVNFAATATAQYSIPWSTIDGGGGTSAGGVYSVSGTIGQPDAGGPMSNGQYAVTGGFWALPTAVQIPGAPLLSIVASGPGRVSISWSPNTPGFVLQESLNLSTTNWLNAVSGGINPANVPAVPPAKFYRLFKP